MNEELRHAMKNNNLYNFMANNYYNFTKEELKNIILEIDYAIYSYDREIHEDITSQALIELESR